MTAPQRMSALPYYGWFVLAASAVSEMLAVGCTSYAAGLFVLPVQREFSLSRAGASSAILIMFLGAAFLAPLAGRILDRYPIRRIICLGAFCVALAFILISFTSSLALMVVTLLVVLAFGYLLLGPMTTATLASRWFFRRRGLALGLAAVATSAGGFIVVPLLNKAIELYGWRPALRGEAVILFVVISALALLVLRDNPFKAGYGEHPENKGRTDATLFSKIQRHDAHGMMKAWRTILGTRGFWAPSLLLGSASGLSQALVTSAPAYGHQLGFTAAASAFLISAFSIAAALTKILTGVMADYWNKRVMLFISALSMPLALGMLCLFTNYGAVVASCALAGVALGGGLPLSGALIASRFGAARFGSVMGWTYVMISGCALGAVLYIGSVFDRSGSYGPGFVGLLLFSLAVTATALFLDLPVKPKLQEPFH